MTIKLKRGLEANIPELQEGELGFTTDSKKLFVGSDAGNIDIGNIEITKIEIGSLIEITWQELKDKRDASLLMPGQQYRITDFVTTTAQANTQSAGHQFDIIITADDVNKLNENARAIQHEGDTYFAYSKLESWQLKYCIDNNTTRFAWADSVNGKGVIYRMIDEWNNDCPYDFKNIKFLRDGIYYYTFTAFENTDETIKDASIMREVSADGMVDGMTNNSMKPYYIYIERFIYPQLLNFNIFKSYYDDGSMVHMPSNNHFELNCNNNFFDGTQFTRSNTFRDSCTFNTFGNSCYSNTFGDSCSSNTFGTYCYSNTFGDNCYLNTFGNYCYFNTFGSNCNYNTFGNYCGSNTFGYECYSNTLGDRCFSNTFEIGCFSNTFGNDCNFNTFGTYCYSNTFGNDCFSNIFGTYCYYNAFGKTCQYNTFGNNCRYLQINDASATTKKYISVDSGTQGASSSNKFDLYDSAILDKNYQVTFKKSASGKYLMLWATDTGTMTGKVKATNTTATWTAL